jgi:hypothetical protein
VLRVIAMYDCYVAFDLSLEVVEWLQDLKCVLVARIGKILILLGFGETAR